MTQSSFRPAAIKIGRDKKVKWILGPSAGPNVKEEPAHPYLTEYRWGETKPAVELKINSVMGYQAFPISVEQAFTH